MTSLWGTREQPQGWSRDARGVVDRSLLGGRGVPWGYRWVPFGLPMPCLRGTDGVLWGYPPPTPEGGYPHPKGYPHDAHKVLNFSSLENSSHFRPKKRRLGC